MINKLIEYLSDKKILILGFGREGMSTYKLIRKYLPNKKIYISDKKENLKNECELIKEDINIVVNEGTKYLENLEDYDIIMKSPGVSLKNIYTSNIITKIKSQLELLLEFFNIYTIGVTGTKGKSTTSSLIYKILKDQGKEVMLLGNIGTPAFDWIESIKENMYLVLEMSSHQLEYMDFSPNIAILLNIFEEHLDHYNSLNSYIEAKCNIFNHQKEKYYYIYNAEIEAITNKNKKYNTKAEKFAVTLNNKNDIEENQNIVTCMQNKIYINNKEVYDANNERKLLGIHNLNNIMFVLAVSEILKLDLNKTIETVDNFEALEHRIEYVGKYNDITFYNDSISTIPESAINSIEALKNVNTLIFGGLDRGIDYSKLTKYLNNSNIENFICLPTTGHKVGKELVRGNVFLVENLEEAVKLAKEYTKKNSICVMSPASASYGFFKNFEERGKKFKELVRQ